MAKPQLFLLHFAGGNCYSYKEMSVLLEDFEVISLELPGRGRRMDEALIKDFELAAADLYQQLISRLNSGRFAIYGHSMGAILALKVTELLEKAGKIPVCLFVSGNPGPGIKENRRRYKLSSDAFIEELKLLGGLPDLFLSNKELMDFFEPILRADFEIAEENGLKEGISVSCPLFAMMGIDEEHAEDISNWSSFTGSVFNCEVLEGGHFFILDHCQRIADIIKHNFDIHDLTTQNGHNHKQFSK